MAPWATKLLSRLSIPYSVHVCAHDPQHGWYGLAASTALDVGPERVFNTLIAEVSATGRNHPALKRDMGAAAHPWCSRRHPPTALPAGPRRAG